MVQKEELVKVVNLDTKFANSISQLQYYKKKTLSANSLLIR